MPTIFAWQQASNSIGTTHDVDFWLLIQSSMLQLLGLFTAMFPIYKRSPAHAWRWAQALTVLGALCSLGSIPLYNYAPTMWSALVSLFGSAQAGMASLIALMRILLFGCEGRLDDRSTKPIYQKWRVISPSRLLLNRLIRH
jgi:hypothetical protein